MCISINIDLDNIFVALLFGSLLMERYGTNPMDLGIYKVTGCVQGGVYFVPAFFANLGNQERNHLEFIRVYT